MSRLHGQLCDALKAAFRLLRKLIAVGQDRARLLAFLSGPGATKQHVTAAGAPDATPAMIAFVAALRPTRVGIDSSEIEACGRMRMLACEVCASLYQLQPDETVAALRSILTSSDASLHQMPLVGSATNPSIISPAVADILHLTSHISHLTPHTSYLTPHISHLTPHISHLTPHISHLTSYILHLTSHTSHLTPHILHLTSYRWAPPRTPWRSSLCLMGTSSYSPPQHRLSKDTGSPLAMPPPRRTPPPRFYAIPFQQAVRALL